MCIIPSPPLLFSLFSSSSLCVSHLILLCTDGWACAALRIPLLADSLSLLRREGRRRFLQAVNVSGREPIQQQETLWAKQISSPVWWSRLYIYRRRNWNSLACLSSTYKYVRINKKKRRKINVEPLEGRRCNHLSAGRIFSAQLVVFTLLEAVGSRNFSKGVNGQWPESAGRRKQMFKASNQTDRHFPSVLYLVVGRTIISLCLFSFPSCFS